MSIILEVLSGISGSGVVWETEKDKINANFVALNVDKAETSDLPTKTSDLTNDSDFISDATYVATDNNFTTAKSNEITANTAKRSYPVIDETRLADTSGTNTGDQDLSDYALAATVSIDLSDKIDKDGAKVLTDINFSSADKVLVDTIVDKQAKQTGYGLSQNSYSDADVALVGNLPINTISSLAAKADLVDSVVPLIQLPDEVKDGGLIQYTDLSSFPNPGDVAILYLAQDTNLIYRWDGSAYVVIATGVVTGTVLEDVELKNYSETATDPSSASGTLVLDLANGNVFDVVLTENVTTLTISNPPESGKGGSFVLILTQDATGNRTVTWPASVTWPSGNAPTLTASGNAVDIVTFITTDAGTTWYGLFGENFV